MSDKLLSPGIKVLRERGLGASVKGSDLGIVYVLGVFEWGEIGKPILILNPTDRAKKVGEYLSSYYGAKAIDILFAQKGISNIYAVRTAHYTAGVCDAVKAAVISQGYNPDDENRVKVNTVNFTGKAEGEYGNKINLTNKKVETVTTAILATGGESVAVSSVEGFEIGDAIELISGVNRIRTIITYINSTTDTLYFKSLTLAGSYAAGAIVITPSTHLIRTVLKSGQTLANNATEIELDNVNGIVKGMVLTVVDKRVGAVEPNHVSFIVKDISRNKIYFDDIGSITSISAVDSVAISQEFNLSVYISEDFVKTIEYISMSATNEKYYINNNFKNDYVLATDIVSAENLIGDIPESFEKLFLTAGDDGLVGLSSDDFVGIEANKTGMYAFNYMTEQFAQIICPDGRWADTQRSLNNYAESRRLWFESDCDSGKDAEENVDFLVNDAMLNSDYSEFNFPNLKWKNLITSVIESIPKSCFVAGLNARIWGKSTSGYGPWTQPAGTEDGILYDVEGLEGEDENGVHEVSDTTIRDYLYRNKINSIIKYSPYGFIKYGIRITASGSQFTQIGESVTFLYCEHSIKNGMPWTVFKNIDESFKSRANSLISTFLESVWKAGGLKGISIEEAFVVDMDSLNTEDTENAGEFYFKIGLATKKAAEFVYFVFSKKIGG